MERCIQLEALRISTAGPHEPVLGQTYTDDRRSANRRVEILVTRALMSDYEAKPQTAEDLSRQAASKHVATP